jgi:four helix bundle protein
MKAQTFQDLMVWQKAHQFVLAVYRLSQSFPTHEIYGLTSQIRRASVSIPANIAEGFKKKTPKEKVRFFNIAQGSLEEVRYYLILTRDLNYGDTEKLAHDLDEIGRMLEGYMKSIRRKSD